MWAPNVVTAQSRLSPQGRGTGREGTCGGYPEAEGAGVKAALAQVEGVEGAVVEHATVHQQVPLHRAHRTAGTAKDVPIAIPAFCGAFHLYLGALHSPSLEPCWEMTLYKFRLYLGALHSSSL